MPVLEFALKETVTTGLRFTYARQHAQVGEAYRLAGQRDEAARLAAIALDAARGQKQRGQEARPRTESVRETHSRRTRW